MKKLTELTAFLINLNYVAAESIDTWVESPKTAPRAKSMGNDTLLLYTYKYDAVISIEDYPHKRHSSDLLFGQLCAWLIENGTGTNEIPEPDIDVDINDSVTANIEIKIAFEEDVYVVEDNAGPIAINGVMYRLADLVIDIAEQGEVEPT